jgi:hypothetical protein
MAKEIEMATENQAETFIRLLMEEFEANRMNRKPAFYRHFTDQPKRREPLYKSEVKLSTDLTEPLDCLQLMSASHRSHGGEYSEIR